MSSAESILWQPPRPSVALCAILSVTVHAGLLAGLGFISKSTHTTESVPVIQISLIPVQSETPTLTPAQTHHPLRSASRSIRPPLPPSSSSQLMTSRLMTLDSALEAPENPKSQNPPPDVQKKRVLKDHKAANALVAQSLMKMIKPKSTQSQTFSPPRPSPPKMTSAYNSAAQPTNLDPSPDSQETQATPSFQTQRGVLMANPPRGHSTSDSKVGIVRFIKPIYPSVAKEAGWAGTVIVRVLVQTNGLPGEVTVRKSSGHSILDRAAMEAVRQWRFKPEKDGNIPINKYVDIPLKFELHSQSSRG